MSIMIAVFLFVIAGLAPIMGWQLHKFDPIAWGLAWFALGHLWSWAPVVIQRNQQ